MILKSYEINKINLNIHKFILFYGKNDWLKIESIKNLNKNKNKILNYEEREILDNPNIFFENIMSKSLFDEEKIIIIKRATDKIVKLIEELSSKNLEETSLIISADNLEKKSKLRSLFEKNTQFACVPFYPDNDQTLSKFTYNFLKEKDISISPSNINLIVSKCNGDRAILLNELKKIEYLYG